MFVADKLRGLWERLPEEERARYPFALHHIDWEDYLWNVHFPGIRKCALNHMYPLLSRAIFSLMSLW